MKSRTPTLPETPLREAWRLALPATLSLLLHSGYRVNDQFWVKGLGADAQAALGIGSFLLILNFAFITLVHSGTLARVARHFGAGDRRALDTAFQSALRFGLGWMLVVAAAGWLTVPFWVRMLGAEGGVSVSAAVYLRRIYLCLPLIALKPLCDGIFIGLGNTLIPMLLSAFAVGLNFALNPLLIYGVGDWGGMGIAGAAWATGISRGCGGLVGLYLLGRRMGLRPRLGARVDLGEIRRILRIGAPMALSTAAYALVFITVLKTSVAPYGRPVQAGLGVAFNGLEAISYCALMGPAIAVSGMVGRRLGAGDVLGARSSVRACLQMSVGVSLLFSLLFLLIPDRLASFYTHDPEVLQQAVLYLSIAAWSQAATAGYSVLEQSLAGAGRTGRLATLTITGHVIRIPLAWILSQPLGFGPAGIWWALNGANYLKLLAIVPLYRHEMRLAEAARD